MSLQTYLARTPSRPGGCECGQHMPRRSSMQVDGDMRRAVCRRCQCALVRTAATRSWIVSGFLG